VQKSAFPAVQVAGCFTELTSNECCVADGSYQGDGTVCEPDADQDGIHALCRANGRAVPNAGQQNADGDSDGVADCIEQGPGAADAVFAPECAGAIPTVSA
jgi:hypothetical protein